MTEVGVTEGVAVWRPLLGHTKDDIYEFAHKYGVPYLQDSTPSWSTRGKLRNQLLPLLMEIYGSGCLHNLSSLAGDSDAMRGLVQKTVFDPFLEPVVRHKCGISVQITDKFLDQSAVFWAEALKQIMHSMGMSLVREKAVKNFVGRIHIFQKKERAKNYGNGKSDRRVSFRSNSMEVSLKIMSGWIELRKGFNCFIDDNNTLCILRPGAIRPSGSASRAAGKATGKTRAFNSALLTVQVPIKDDLSVGTIQVESNEDNGLTVDILPRDAGAGIHMKLSSAAQLLLPPQAAILDIDVCPIAVGTVDLNKLRVPITFTLEYGVWLIHIQIMSPTAAVDMSSRSRASSYDSSPAQSDGEQSDFEEDSIWKWAPGVKSQSAGPKLAPVLSNIFDLLRGEFSYEFQIYQHNCKVESGSEKSIIPLRLNAGITAAAVRDLNLRSFKGIDAKIREGLPLVSPLLVSEPHQSFGNKKIIEDGHAICKVVLSYSYIQEADDVGH